MTDDLAHLYSAVWEVPEDDTARLVLADCLEESGDWKRAEAIRRGVAKPKRFTFAEGKPAHGAWTSTRRDESYGKVVDVALAPGVPGVKWTTFKGTVESAMCSWGTWLERCDEVLRVAGGLLAEVVLTERPQIAQYEAVIGRLASEPRMWWCAVPGRKGHMVAEGQDYFATVLDAEFPQVRRFLYPKRIAAMETSRDRFHTTDLVAPTVGATVQLADGTIGVVIAMGNDPLTGVIRTRPNPLS